MSISEIAASVNKSYAAVRKRLLASGVTLRSKEEAARTHIEKHPEWSKQFIKYHVDKTAELTDDKIVLLTMVITEGYVDRTSVGFTNTQDSLHTQFERLLTKVYVTVRVGRSGNLSRVSSIEIADDLSSMMPRKTFNEPIFGRLIKSTQVAAKILRTIADTEGSMIVSIRKAPRNYTVESRVVLASTNPGFSNQISALLATLRIHSRSNADGVIIHRKYDIGRFTRIVGFSPGVRSQKESGSVYLVWKGEILPIKIVSQSVRRAMESEEVWRERMLCRLQDQRDVVIMLTNWYEKTKGGERQTW